MNMFKDQYIIIDDFYDDPDTINDLVKTLPTEEISAGNYAGVMSELSLYTDDHEKFFNSISREVQVQPCSSQTSLKSKSRFYFTDNDLAHKAT